MIHPSKILIVDDDPTQQSRMARLVSWFVSFVLGLALGTGIAVLLATLSTCVWPPLANGNAFMTTAPARNAPAARSIGCTGQIRPWTAHRRPRPGSSGCFGSSAHVQN